MRCSSGETQEKEVGTTSQYKVVLVGALVNLMGLGLLDAGFKSLDFG